MPTFDTEIKRLYPVLLERSTGLMRSREKGMDILHEVIASLGDKREKMEMLSQENKLDFYLSRAIYLSARSPMAGAYRKLALIGTDIEVDVADPGDQTGDYQLTREQLDLMISRLPDFDAELIKLWMSDSFSYDDCSQITGIPKTDLYNSIRSSINKLKQYVNPES